MKLIAFLRTVLNSNLSGPQRGEAVPSSPAEATDTRATRDRAYPKPLHWNRTVNHGKAPELSTPAKDQANYQMDLTKATHEQRSAVITCQLLHDLGKPDALYRVDVRPLWDGHYRVNVFIGKDTASTRLAHSYSLVTDADGKILASDPDIARQY